MGRNLSALSFIARSLGFLSCKNNALRLTGMNYCSVSIISRLDVTLSCMMDLKLFPIDYQECPLVIQSCKLPVLLARVHGDLLLDAYIEQIVNLTWHVDPPYFPIGSNVEIKLNDMSITKTRYEKCAGPYPMFRGSG